MKSLKLLFAFAVLAHFGSPAWAGDVYDKLGPDMGSGSRGNTAPAIHRAMGVVRSVDAAKNEVTIDHEAVKSLKWPGMTMPFRVKDRALLEKFTIGKKVEFELAKEGAGYVIVGVK